MNKLDIKLQANDENFYTLNDFNGKKVVLYFYPKDNTPGCTLESTDFTSLKKEFEDLNSIIIGVSRDSVKSHQNFCNKQGLEHLLLSDNEELLCKAFDVLKLKKNYGREYIGIERSTFILDESGNVIKEFRKVKTKGHAESILEEIKSL